MTGHQRPCLTALVFCYLIRDGSVLLIRREHPPQPGAWTVPGGHKETGEDLEQACKREVLEETGLQLQTLRWRGAVTIGQAGGPEVLAFYFSSDCFTGQLQASDEGDLRWFTLDGSWRQADISPYYREITPYLLDQVGFFTGRIEVDPLNWPVVFHLRAADLAGPDAL